jgi:hypothetical protein
MARLVNSVNDKLFKMNGGLLKSDFDSLSMLIPRLHSIEHFNFL